MVDTALNTLRATQREVLQPARMSRDLLDIQDLLRYFSTRNPFRIEGPSRLRSIATGVEAHDRVNCDTAKDVGIKILALMPGMKVNEHSFRKKDQAITMDAEGTIKSRTRK